MSRLITRRRTKPGVQFKMEHRNELTEHYFNQGYQQKEILSSLLLIHDQKLEAKLQTVDTNTCKERSNKEERGI